MADEPETIHSAGLTRRSFTIAMGSAVLGTFVMPAPSGAPVEGADVPVQDVTEAVARRLRQLVGRPVKSKSGHAFAWTERWESDGQIHVMVWTPETPQEWAEAERFYAVARWRSWNTREQLAALLQRAGSWLIRYNFSEVYNFIFNTYENFLFGPGDQVVFTNDPIRAVPVTSALALHLIPKLMDAYGNWDDGPIYFEPVRPEHALRNLRDLELYRLG